MVRRPGLALVPMISSAALACVACAGVPAHASPGAADRGRLSGPGGPPDSRSAGAGSSAGTIAGQVFDSLSARPLAQAHVHVQGTGREVVTDSAGQFRLDSVPGGPQSIWIDHPKLDSLGIFTLTAPVTVSAGREAAVKLGIPSFATIWRRSCAEALPANDAEAGLIYGHVKSVFGWAVDSTAFVQAVWTAAGGKRTLGRARVDTRGNYVACGVPRDRSVAVYAVYQGAATIAIVIPGGRSRIVRRDLTLATDFEIAFDTTLNGAIANGRVGEENGGSII